MHSGPQFQRRCFLMITALLFFQVLTACGSNASKPTSTNVPASHTSTPRLTSGSGTSGTKTGCPNHDNVTTPPGSPTLLLKPSATRQSYLAHLGDTIEVDLPIGIAWAGPMNATGGLQMQTPAGYAWKTECIWRFVARSTGTVKLAFDGSALCKKAVPCLLSEIYEEFMVVVQ